MSNKVVVDTSLVIKWLLAEEDSHLADQLLFDWIDKGTTLLAPPLMVYEVINILYQHIRTGHLTLENARAAFTEMLYSLGLEIDFLYDVEIGHHTLEQTRQLALPATYDTHFLSLAAREQCEFWTADIHLWRTIKDKYPWVRNLQECHVKQI